jgi:cytochrome c peroxidase
MTLVTDQTRYDAFMSGDNGALTQDELKGLLTFINTESPLIGWNPVFNGIEAGSCQLCHSGPELSENTKVNVPAAFFVTVDVTSEMDQGRELVIVPSTTSFDVGFSNVGVRPNREDLGRGGTELGKPLSLFRQALIGLVIPPGPIFPVGLPFPNNNRGTNIDGAFKIPMLRNIELTGPYFHNGGELTLAQAVQFYARRGDYADQNINDIDIGLIMVDISDEGVDLIVKFLLTLTDQRTILESAPFDHPSLTIPNGHPGNNVAVTSFTTANGVNQADDLQIVLPAVGAAGWPNAAASPVHSFMNISSTPVPGDNNDHFDR